MNHLGYEYLQKGDVEAALLIFKMNMEAGINNPLTYTGLHDKLYVYCCLLSASGSGVEVPAADSDEAMRFLLCNDDSLHGPRLAQDCTDSTI